MVVANGQPASVQCSHYTQVVL